MDVIIKTRAAAPLKATLLVEQDQEQVTEATVCRERKIQQSFPLMNRQGEESQVKILAGYRPGTSRFWSWKFRQSDDLDSKVSGEKFGQSEGLDSRVSGEKIGQSDGLAIEVSFLSTKIRQSLALIDRSKVFDGRVLAGQTVGSSDEKVDSTGNRRESPRHREQKVQQQGLQANQGSV